MAPERSGPSPKLNDIMGDRIDPLTTHRVFLTLAARARSHAVRTRRERLIPCPAHDGIPPCGFCHQGPHANHAVRVGVFAANTDHRRGRSRSLPTDRAPRVLGWLDLAEGRLTSRSPPPQWRPANFLPLVWPPHGAGAAGTPTRPFLARQESWPATILRRAAGPRGLRRRSPPACRSPSRPRWARSRETDRSTPWRPSAPSRNPPTTPSPAR